MLHICNLQTLSHAPVYINLISGKQYVSLLISHLVILSDAFNGNDELIRCQVKPGQVNCRQTSFQIFEVRQQEPCAAIITSWGIEGYEILRTINLNINQESPNIPAAILLFYQYKCFVLIK